MIQPDSNRNVRYAFYHAVVRRMHQEGATVEEVRAELECLTGNPVQVDIDAYNNPCYTIDPYGVKKGEDDV